MIEPQSVAGLVRGFRDEEDGAAMKSRELILALLECSPAPFSREQFTPGHITATGLVVNPAGDRLLLVHHRRLDRWLLPGGHVEPGDREIHETSRREVVEETGAVLPPGEQPRLAGLDVHGIPGNGREPYHLHHDLVFSFRAGDEQVRVSHESRGIAWCGPEEFDRYRVPLNVRLVWRRMRAWRIPA
jgi:8-oxo-dGTP pyrophosphatase MutT (NUDIX family)